jgi:hypothetical protein
VRDLAIFHTREEGVRGTARVRWVNEVEQRWGLKQRVGEAVRSLWD